MFGAATKIDHTAQSRAVYHTTLFTYCDLTFVLTSGIANEPEKQRGLHRLSHRLAATLYIGTDDGLAKQTQGRDHGGPNGRTG